MGSRQAAALALALSLPGAAAAAPNLTTAPVKWFDADNKPVPEPAEAQANEVWDFIDKSSFYQVGKLLDLGWTARRIGDLLGVAGPRQADNVNALDEVPNSSWFTNRHFLHPMTLEELAAGPGFAEPDDSGPWEVVAGTFEGVTAGFTIRDASKRYFLLKFDSRGNDEMGSGAEAVVTKVLHAAGYNVPRNSVLYFDPGQLRIGPEARVPDGDGGKRPMTPEDLRKILARVTPQADGTLRCLASRFLEGKPVGVFNYNGRRRDDPNDRVDHEHRRELRGLRVIGSWLNDTDLRAANTLDMYVTGQDGRGCVRHYLVDMGSALGSGGSRPHQPRHGNEYMVDPGAILRSLLSLGFYVKKWEEPLPMTYASLGYFENETFRPGRWVPDYPNPAFERCTNRDGYWGAKIVMAFGDDDIRAMVERGRYSDPGAADELTRLLAERRDMIGRYWFERVNPLDRFEVEEGRLRFADLAVEGGLAPRASRQWRYAVVDADGDEVGEPRRLAETVIPVGEEARPGRFFGYLLQSRNGERASWSKKTTVFVYKHEDGRPQLVRIDREE